MRIALCFNGLAGGKNDKGFPVDWQVNSIYLFNNCCGYVILYMYH